MTRTPAQMGRLMAFALGLAGVCMACNGANGRDAFEPAPMMPETHAEELLSELLEQGLAAEMSASTPEDARDIEEAILDRRRAAQELDIAVAGVTAPMAAVLTVFAVESLSDVALTFTPVHKLARVRALIKRGRSLKKARKRAQLRGVVSELDQVLDADTKEILRLGNKLKRGERAALVAIAQRTGSAQLTRELLSKHLARQADLAWIARLMRKHEDEVDVDFVRRFTFDEDLVRDVNGYDAHVPWTVLRDVVDRRRVDDAARACSKSLREVRGKTGMAGGPDTVRGYRPFRRTDRRSTTLGGRIRG